MIRRLAFPVLVVLAVLFVLIGPAAAQDVPRLTGRVNDYANLIPQGQRQGLEAKLAQFEQQTGNQVAVLTIPGLEGEAIEDYANRVARAWALGQKGKDNGVLLLVASQDRKMRIEVGYGLEPVLTDLQTSIIQNEVIIPYFKRGDFGGGIEAGVDAILSTIQGKELEPAPVQEPGTGGGRGGNWPGFLVFALAAAFPFLMSAIRSGSWIVYIILLPILFITGSILHPVVGLILAGVWLVLFPILRLILPKRPKSGRFRGPGGGWWIGPGLGGGGGGWGGGGGGGFGGFSGGGGSFGGGGSSSSW
jgi:uncharacterized protein